MQYLSIEETSQQYRIPVDTLTAWCREGTLKGARRQLNGKWYIPKASIEQFLDAKDSVPPYPDKPTRPGSWGVAAVVFLVAGLVADIIALRDILGGGNDTLLWNVSIIIGIVIFLVGLFIVRTKRPIGVRGYIADEPVFITVPRYGKSVRLAAIIVLIVVPVMVILGTIGHWNWRMIPQERIVVLIADIVEPNGTDPAGVTERLVQGIRSSLSEHSNIHVKRLNQVISQEAGSEYARQVASQPRHRASIVIWGSYVLEPSPTVHVHVDTLAGPTSELETRFFGTYAATSGSTSFDLQLGLANHLSKFTAFVSALILSNTGNYEDAAKLFDVVAQSKDSFSNSPIEQVFVLNRALNDLRSRQFEAAESSLIALTQNPQSDTITLDTLGALGFLRIQQGDYEEARNYLADALVRSREKGNVDAEAHFLSGLSSIAALQGDYSEAATGFSRVLLIFHQLGNRSGEASALVNLGLVRSLQGDFASAMSYYNQSLAILLEMRDMNGLAGLYSNRGILRTQMGDYTEAREDYQSAVQLYEDTGNPRGQVQVLTNLSILSALQGDHAAARVYLEKAKRLEMENDQQ